VFNNPPYTSAEKTEVHKGRYDGHTLATVIPMEDMIGNTIERLLADAAYRGHNAPTDYKFRVYTSGQKHRLTPQIKRELRRRAAIEPVIGHLKAEHRMGRNYLAHHAGDTVNAVLAAPHRPMLGQGMDPRI
jgi:IS5 family transposase